MKLFLSFAESQDKIFGSSLPHHLCDEHCMKFFIYIVQLQKQFPLNLQIRLQHTYFSAFYIVNVGNNIQLKTKEKKGGEAAVLYKSANSHLEINILGFKYIRSSEHYK